MIVKELTPWAPPPSSRASPTCSGSPSRFPLSLSGRVPPPLLSLVQLPPPHGEAWGRGCCRRRRRCRSDGQSHGPGLVRSPGRRGGWAAGGEAPPPPGRAGPEAAPRRPPGSLPRESGWRLRARPPRRAERSEAAGLGLLRFPLGQLPGSFEPGSALPPQAGSEAGPQSQIF